MKKAWGILTIIILSLFFLAGVNSAFAVIANDDYYTTDNGRTTILNVSAPGVLGNDLGKYLTVESIKPLPSNGTLSWVSDGSFSYTPRPGFYGEDSFDYCAATTYSFDIATVHITVNVVHPVAVDDFYQTNVGEILTVFVEEGVLSNDVAPEGDTLEAQLSSFALPSNGLLTLNSSGSFKYTPNADFSGEDSFGYEATTYYANGTTKDLDTATVSIKVASVNDPPVANANGSYAEEEGNRIYFNASGSSDPDGDKLQYRWDFDSDGTWDTSWSPFTTASHTWYDDHSGTVTVEVSDGDLTDTDTSSVTVTNVAPRVKAGPDAAVESAFSSSGQFSDPSKVDTWTATVDYGDGSGTPPLTFNPDKTFALDHVYADNGVYTVTVTVTDDDVGVGSDTLTVTVNPVNDAPVANANFPYAGTEGSAITFDASGSGDPDGDALQYRWDFDGDGIWDTDYSSDPTANYTRDDDYSGTVILEVSDSVLTDTDSGDVTVANVAPTVDAGVDQTVNEGDTVTFSGTFTDPGTDTWTYDWDFGDGATAIGTLTPDHIYTDNGTYTVTLTITDDDGGVGTDTLTVTVADLGPTAEFTWAPGPQDEGLAIQFTDASTSYPDDIVSWSWDFGGLGSSTDQYPSFTFMDDGVYTVTLTVTDDDGSTDTISHDVTVNDLSPAAAFTWSPESQDEGSPVQFTDASTSYPDDIASWSWDFGGLGTSAEQNPSFTFVDDGTYTVTLTVTDDDGSTDTASHTVTVADLSPTAAFTWSPEPQNEGVAVEFSDRSTSDPDAIVLWSWDFAGLGTSTLQNPFFTFTDDGAYTVTLTVTDDDGSADTASHTVTVLDLAPTAAFISSPEPQDEGSPVDFTDTSTSSSDVITGWSWDFGGLDTSTEQDPSFTFTDDGAYTVTLTVTDDDGSADTASHTVTVLDLAPTAAFISSPEPQDEGSPVDFTDTSTSSSDVITGWSWDFGGLDTSTEQDPSFTFTDDGAYTVTLTVTDDDGSTDTASHTVTVADLSPTAAFISSPEPQDEGSLVQFTDASSSYPDAIADWSWDFGGPDTSTEQNPSFTFIDDGAYTVTLTVTDDDGSMDTASHTVTVVDLSPTAAFISSPEPQDEGSPVDFTDTSTSSSDVITDWSWDFGGLGTSTLQNPSFTFTDDGTYTVTLTVTDDDGSTDTVTNSVTVLNVPPVVDAGPDANINEGSDFTSSGSFADPGADTWTATVDYGDGSGNQTLALNLDKTFDLNHVYADNGVYTVTLTVTDGDGGVGTDTLTVTVLDLAPTAAFTWSPEPQDEGSSVQFTDVSASHPDAIVGWSWDFGGRGSSSDQHPTSTFMDNGNYPVALTVMDDDGTTDTVTNTVTVLNVLPVVNAGPDSIIDEGDTFISSGWFTDPGADTWTATVDYGDGSGVQPLMLIDKTFGLSHVYADNGEYAVTVVVSDGDDVGFDTAVVTVNNTPPEITSISALLDPVQVGTAISASASFTDPGTADTHTATWDWGEDEGTMADTVTEPNGSDDGSVAGSHTYSTPGVYTLELIVTDDDGGSGTEVYQYVVVYDPEGGFVTGGGWIMSPEGAYAADLTLEGKASFGFVSKYKKGADTPTGETEFQFKVASLNFHSTAYQWLVVAGHQAKYKGSGEIDGTGDYGFMLSAVDGDIAAGDDEDKFRIKIWDKATDAVVYDNEMGDADDAEPTTVIGGGSIKIHTGANAAPPRPAFVSRGAALPDSPRRFRLLANYPNPFNPETWLPYELAEDRSVTIRIYNAGGQLVRLLDLGHKPAGFYTSREKSAYWDGRNEAGESVSSGIYFYQIQAGEFSATRKMTILR